MKTVLITGSTGLVGSEAVAFFAERDFKIIGIDNDMRSYFFGKSASTKENINKFKKTFKDQYNHYSVDIRDKRKITNIFKNEIDLIIHTAAQPSHDWAVKEPFTDYEINANGTLILLENYRKYNPQAIFIQTSTNKVYGDTPNKLNYIELDTRWELDKNHEYYNGIDEKMSIDNSLHSIFGASKLSADILVQEYGKYFNLKTSVFRCGCITGGNHKGAEMHGFLAYLGKCIATGSQYKIYGYKKKQVRDNIHAYDLVNCFWHFSKNPKYGEVYNMGGSRHSNISMLEAIKCFETSYKKKSDITYIEENRKGDHIWYISNIDKFKYQYPEWNYKHDIYSIIDEICKSYQGSI